MGGANVGMEDGLFLLFWKNTLLICNIENKTQTAYHGHT
jgi:hypothetical protein